MKHRIAIGAIATVIVLAGLATAYNKVDHVRYWILDMVYQGAINAVAMGSSSIRSLPLDYFQQCPGLVKRGFGGGTLTDLERYLDISLLNDELGMILIYAGENDIVYGDSAAATFQQFESLSARLTDRFTDAHIYIVAPKLSPARSSYHPEIGVLNQRLDDLEQMPMVTVLTSRLSSEVLPQYYLADGVHLTRQGYTEFLQGVPTTC